MSSGPADKVLDIFKSLIFDELVKVVIAKVIDLAPFLSWGPVSFIVGKVITYIAGELYEVLKDIINFEVILLKNREHHVAYVNAHIQLRNIAKEKGIDSDEFKAQRKIQAAALASFIRYGGT